MGQIAYVMFLHKSVYVWESICMSAEFFFWWQCLVRRSRVMSVPRHRLAFSSPSIIHTPAQTLWCTHRRFCCILLFNSTLVSTFVVELFSFYVFYLFIVFSWISVKLSSWSSSPRIPVSVFKSMNCSFCWFKKKKAENEHWHEKLRQNDDQ